MKSSFRSIFVWVAVFAVALAWWLDHDRLQKAITKLNSENAELMGRIIPSSGFAFRLDTYLQPDGFRDFSYSSPDDRQEVLGHLDRSFTHGKNSKNLVIADPPR